MVKRWIVFAALCGFTVGAGAQSDASDAPPPPSQTQNQMPAPPAQAPMNGSSSSSDHATPPPLGPSIDVTDGNTWVTINCGMQASLKDCAAVASALLSQNSENQPQSGNSQ